MRAYENGWLLEIQEPTVIRDAAVLMALNSALEPDGSINLPTRIVHRHPDFIAVITTNRSYNGCRPLNEAFMVPDSMLKKPLCRTFGIFQRRIRLTKILRWPLRCGLTSLLL